MLGLIVMVGSFLVFALHLEIEGPLPWKQAEAEEAEWRSQESQPD